MKIARDIKRIETAKKNDQQLILQDEKNREFFRFEGGRLIEYDLTKYRGREVRLNETEKEGIASFPQAIL